MNKIKSFSDLENLIEQHKGKPKILEALWDGDTEGWFLCIMLYTKKRFSITLNRSQIGYISLGNDSRLFTGEVPVWPEAELAKEIGEKAKLKYNLKFYFPSPDEPDDDCPAYFQKHLAINCTDCGKLIIPTTSEYLPKDCCHNCHLIRERNDKIIKAKEYNVGTYFYKVKNNVYTNLGYASDYKSFDIYQYTKDIFSEQKIKGQISIIKIENSERIISLKDSLNKLIIDALSAYNEPDRTRKGKWGKIYNVNFNNNTYELQPYINNHHDKVFGLIKNFELLTLVINENYHLEFYIRDNFTYRDDAFLRFLKYTKRGRTTVEQFIHEFNPLLEISDINNVINKLKKLKCITSIDHTIEISEIGKKII